MADHSDKARAPRARVSVALRPGRARSNYAGLLKGYQVATYLYEQLDDETFQQLCQALLVKLHPGLQCLPVGQPDGGRDAFLWLHDGDRRDLLVYQVKFVRKPETIKDPHKWIASVLKGEAPKIADLLKESRVQSYVLLTNVSGTAHSAVGSVDTVDDILRTNLPVPSQCWWRDDLDRRLDGEWDLKWRYHTILTGADALSMAFQLGVGEHRERRESAIRAFLTHQYDADREVKFKQIELQNDLVDLFIDVPLTLSTRAAPQREARRRAAALTFVAQRGPQRTDLDHGQAILFEEPGSEFSTPSVGAAELLLHPDCIAWFPRVVLEGAPGQGKSTLAQYVCQVHRIHLLGYDTDLNTIPANLRDKPPRLPIKVDLRDYAIWLARLDPFDPDNSSTPHGWRRSLETFLAHQIQHQSGGIEFEVGDLHAVSRVSAMFLVLDGLDEVADVAVRNALVNEVTVGVRRLESTSASLHSVITSRPANFANSPGFSERTFTYFDLAPLPRSLVVDYTDKWIEAKRLSLKDSRDVRRIVAQRLEEPHLRELARNPMQLAILLSLIHTRGVSLPDKRTALYNIYIDIFFNREAEKDDGVRKHRDLLIDIHGFLAWVLQSESESGGSGRIGIERVHVVLGDYLEREERSRGLVDELFRGMVHRVLALVSRIQGTLEFEVQPLREYFVARYLYETAPPSAVGAERSGSKPDRFEAMATNFYWLNTTRFYAGFYHKGELPSLVEQIEGLLERPGYRNIRHPRMLAAMLLSDWVFAQNNRSMRRIVELVLDGLGVKEVLLSGWPSGGTGAIVLSEGNGREELVDRCFEILASFPPYDYARELGQILAANLSSGEVLRRWVERLDEVTDSGRSLWFSYLGVLNVGPKLSGEQFDALVRRADGDPRLIVQLWLHGQEARCEASESFTRIVCDALLGGELTLYPRPESEATPLAYLASALSPYVADFVISNGREVSQQPLEHYVRWRFGVNAAPAKSRDSLSADLKEFVEICARQRRRRTRDWAGKLQPWNEIIEAGRRLWGDRRAFSTLAVVAAGVKSRSEGGDMHSDLLDHSAPLVYRVRYARLRAGSAAYWRPLLRADYPSTDRHLIASVVLSWAGNSVFRECRDELDALLESLSPSEFNLVASTLRIQSSITTTLNPQEIFSACTAPNARLLVGVGLRSPTRARNWLVDTHLLGPEPKEPAVFQFAADVIQTVEPFGEDSWQRLARLASTAYTANTPIGLWGEPVRRRGDEMPLAVAEQITAAAERYPRQLVGLAEARCRVTVGESATHVAAVAKRDGWFD